MWLHELQMLLTLPRAQQFEALKRLREVAGQNSAGEEWNSVFGTQSVYEAWTQLPLMQHVYTANRAILRPLLEQRSPWHIVEIGGGNGALWQGFFSAQERGVLTLIDPNPEVHATVAAVLPAGIELHSHVARVENVELPDADGVVCSLMLHHIAGRDRDQRNIFQMAGPGKREILQRCVQAVRTRRGLCLLNEADVYNEIDLEPSDPVLIEHFIDVYVRRAAMAVATALEQNAIDISLKQRWEIILRHWCLDQVNLAFVSREERDVYELDVAQWLRLLRQAGAQVLSHTYTDEWYLFHQYVFSANERGGHMRRTHILSLFSYVYSCIHSSCFTACSNS